MNYADITFKDPNYIKRWLQYNRLWTGVRLSTNYLNKIENALDLFQGHFS